MTRLLLAGGGHAHLEILRRLIESPLPNVETTLVSGSPQHHYSGMVPGFLAGTYSEEDIAFDLEPLCRKAGARFIVETVVALHPETRQISTQNGFLFDYDLCSLNLGSEAAGSRLPEFTAAEGVKPISRVVQLRQDLLRASREKDQVQVAVVGAGAAGFEVSCALRKLIVDQGKQPLVRLFDAATQILPGYSNTFQRKGRRVLDRFGIKLLLDQRVARVEPDSLVTESGRNYPADRTVWLTGAAAPPLLEESGLAVSSSGFLLVDDHLRSISNPYVLAVGDCATLVNFPDTPKAGVYSVRQGPVLWQTIQNSFGRGEPVRYQPQQGFLSILNTCDGKALLRYKAVVSHSRSAWWLKDWIDRKFMKKYKSLVD